MVGEPILNRVAKDPSLVPSENMSYCVGEPEFGQHANDANEQRGETMGTRGHACAFGDALGLHFNQKLQG